MAHGTRPIYHPSPCYRTPTRAPASPTSQSSPVAVDGDVDPSRPAPPLTRYPKPMRQPVPYPSPHPWRLMVTFMVATRVAI